MYSTICFNRQKMYEKNQTRLRGQMMTQSNTERGFGARIVSKIKANKLNTPFFSTQVHQLRHIIGRFEHIFSLSDLFQGDPERRPPCLEKSSDISVHINKHFVISSLPRQFYQVSPSAAGGHQCTGFLPVVFTKQLTF